jgi:sterol desaturase/sphingolipid hydroxylase (fatty acid hydroxylase superfamily)
MGFVIFWTGVFLLLVPPSRPSYALVFYLPLAWLGFPPQMILAAYAINLLYQFWIHAEWIPKLGFLEGILNTPSAHRVHHGAKLEYLDVNYGGILLIFDRMFGTYRSERDDVKIRYGLVEPQLSNNHSRFCFRNGCISFEMLFNRRIAA